MLFSVLLAAALVTPRPAPLIHPSPAPAPAPTAAAPVLPPAEHLLGLIRAAFRAHRPPPPFVTYTLTRTQKTEQGYPDYVDSYAYHIWCRTSDRAALARKVFRDTYRGDPEFQRPVFNEDRDPGPPTADLFEPAPLKPHPVSFVPTPEPEATALREIGAVRAIGEFDYRVVTDEFTNDGQIHVKLEPTRDPMRNRLRDLWVDAHTYELNKLDATDRLFVSGDGPTQVYSVLFTVVVGRLAGFPVVTDIHGVIGDNYVGDGQVVDFTFRDIKFPTTLPEWYFDPRSYGQHLAQMPI